MRGRTPDAFELSKPDERRIRTLLRNGDTPLRVARRARMLLDRAQGSRPSAVVRTVDQNRTTVWRVCARYQAGGLYAALYDAPRCGRRPDFSPTGSATD